MTQFNIDVLNAAQQELAQSCVDDQFPATYTGKYPSPSTVPYPSGVDKATHILNGTVAPAPTATKTVSSWSLMPELTLVRQHLDHLVRRCYQRLRVVHHPSRLHGQARRWRLGRFGLRSADARRRWCRSRPLRKQT